MILSAAVSPMGRGAGIGFWLLAAAVVIAGVWLGFGSLLPGLLPWFPVAVAVLAVVGSACLFFRRAQPTGTRPERMPGEIVVGQEEFRHQLGRVEAASDYVGGSLEHIAKALVHLGGSLERIGHELGGVGHRLDRHSDQMVEMIQELVRGAQKRELASFDSEPSVIRVVERSEAPGPDLRPVLVAAWKRYLSHGNGHFNAGGFRDQLADTGIDAKVQGLDGGLGDAVLVVVDPSVNDGSFFAVPDFTRSPEAAGNWFEDQSSRRLGGRIDELRKLARGRWTESGPEVIEKGIVA